MMMDRVNAIIRHPLYQKYYEKLMTCEQDRIFCRHQIEHLLDVARIAYIQNLEQNLGFHKDVIYAAAILHDIGKFEQYKNQTPHEIAGEKVAWQILRDLNEQYADDISMQFSEEEIALILSAIRNHRRVADAKLPLDHLLYVSDKLSRNCFSCPAKAQCNWSEEKKNRGVVL